MGRIVKESITTCLKLDYYAGEELSKDDRKPNLDKKNRVYLHYSLRGNVKKNCAASANYLILFENIGTDLQLIDLNGTL